MIVKRDLFVLLCACFVATVSGLGARSMAAEDTWNDESTDQRRADGVVAGSAVRHVHPLGAVCRARRPVEGGHGSRGMDSNDGQDPNRSVRRVCRAIQSDRIRRGSVGSHGEAGGHEVPGHHVQTSRRVLSVAQ